MSQKNIFFFFSIVLFLPLIGMKITEESKVLSVFVDDKETEKNSNIFIKNTDMYTYFLAITKKDLDNVSNLMNYAKSIINEKLKSTSNMEKVVRDTIR